MSYDYDRVSDVFPCFGANGLTADGTHFAQAVLPADGGNSGVTPNAPGGYKSITALASLPAAAAYSAVSWVWQDSPDNSTWTNIDASLVVTPMPSSTSTPSLSSTAQAFMTGTITKQPYVRVAISVSGGSTADIIYLLGYPSDAPAFQNAIVGFEG